MNVNAKINDTIFFLMNNKVASSKVVARMTVENTPPYEVKNANTTTSPFGHPSGTTYYTQSSRMVEAENAFSTKEELIASL